MRTKPHIHWSTTLILAGLVFSLLSPSTGFSHTIATDAKTLSGNVLVRVKSFGSEIAIPDAQVDIHPLGLTGVSGPDGEVRWDEIPLNGPVNPLIVEVRAEGYGGWTLKNVRLLAGDTLIIKPKLSTEAFYSEVPPPRAEKPAWFTQSSITPLSAAGGDINDFLTYLPFLTRAFDGNALIRNNANVPLPLKIRVRVAGYPYHCDTSRDYTVETIDFRDYVKGVLPNEWGATWPDDSLRAGAMAVKMYAWSYISLGGKWPDADVWDSTCDQVYNPNFESAKASAAVDYIWDHVLDKNGLLAHTSYRAFYSQCVDANKEGRCMGQWESKYMAEEGYSWIEILEYFYEDSFVRLATPRPASGYMLRFKGQIGDLDKNRVLIPVDDPENSDPGPAVDVGGDDFTIEWWMKASAADNSSAGITCGTNANWTNGNIVLDRSRLKGNRGYGVSVAGGRLAFGIYGEEISVYTLCGAKSILDNEWHHVAVQRQRATGKLWIFVDGALDGTADGPTGDVSYPDGGEPLHSSDPFLGISAWKQDTDQQMHPYFRGFIDELRFSDTLRYAANFTPPDAPLTPDGDTVALYPFDEGLGELIIDAALAPQGPSYGILKYGGINPGPVWLASEKFSQP